FLRGHRRDRSFVAHSAKLFVVNRREDCWIFAADRTLRIASQVELAKYYLKRIEMEKTSNEYLADAQNQFQCFNRLQHSDYARQNAKHARLRAVGNGLRWRRLRKKTSIAWAAQMRREHHCLSFKAKYRAVDIGLACKNTDIVRQISCRKIIRSINDYVVTGHELRRVCTGETAFVQFDLDLRIDVVQAIPGRLQL